VERVLVVAADARRDGAKRLAMGRWTAVIGDCWIGGAWDVRWGGDGCEMQRARSAGAGAGLAQRRRAPRHLTGDRHDAAGRQAED